jgi:maltose alpha-D-glucosyltransferase/alpha-amylase
MLLAEANQWPEDAVAYFGSGDEFHMAFNFPLMPRLFMAVRMEDRFPIIDILRQTPPIPEDCQWALLLRNHDELTLEMVTEEERDYMYRVYAADPAARLNLGIRRRLAPLLGNDRRKIELMYSLLFSLQGTPVIYYGDEIGMGDNFHLNDRDGVRTPMQWSPQRNAGFSNASPKNLYLPIVADPAYHCKVVNVKDQSANPDSLLQWIRHLITLRKRHKAFARGSIEFLQPENHKVLAYLRHYEDETILAIANLSHLAQQTRLDLSRFKGCRPVDLFGRGEFDTITDSQYYFTLSPYSFFWFSLERPSAESLQLRTPTAAEAPVIDETGANLFSKKGSWFLLEKALLDYVRRQRWFRGKAREAWAAAIQDVIPVHFSGSTAYFTLLQVEYPEGEPETYVIPLITAPEKGETEILQKHPQAAVAWLQQRGKDGKSLLYEATFNREFCSSLLSIMKRRRSLKGISGEIITSPTALLGIDISKEKSLEPSLLKTEQSNTSIVYGRRFILKIFRKPDEGISPEVEIGRFLTEETHYTNISPLAASLEYRVGRKKPVSLAVLQNFIPNEGDAWQYTLDMLERYFEASSSHPTAQSPPVPRKTLPSLPKELPALARDTIGTYIASAQLLGQRTAELHIALASGADNPEFSPEPYTLIYQTSLYQSLRGSAVRTMQLLRERFAHLPEETQEGTRAVLDREKTIIDRYNLVRREKINAARIRCHGDYHLGQVLFTGKDFVIIDFEGEPARSLSERRIKHSPLRDVAGMIRSFHYAAHTGLAKQATLHHIPEDALPLLKNWTQFWYVWVSSAFLNTYLDNIKSTGLIPPDSEQVKILLDAFLLEKAMYEVSYELNNRPSWVKIPLQGILDILEAEG